MVGRWKGIRRASRAKQRRPERDCGCFQGRRPHGGGVSLNRSEQRLFDYLQSNRDERQHWEQKVRSEVRENFDEHAACRRLEAELWRYYLERSAVAAPFKEAARHEGLTRTSMRNLAELLVRLWTEPRRMPKPSESGSE